LLANFKCHEFFARAFAAKHFATGFWTRGNMINCTAPGTLYSPYHSGTVGVAFATHPQNMLHH
jgi:hypothetical protein